MMTVALKQKHTYPIEDLQPSKMNPAARMKLDAADDFVESIRKHGVMQPILIRPIKGKKPFEIVAGHRRFAGARLAGLEEIPAIARPLSDEEALELQLVENVQRLDLHPLDEANGYWQLSRLPGYDVAKIAARVGRSEKYIYDRIKLLSLTKEAQAAFLAERFTSGHAILLARLSPADQKRALDPDAKALFQPEHPSFLPDEEPEEDPTKAVSVREFEAWINDHVRFNPAANDLPELFPETAAALSQAKDAEEKIVPITYEHYIQQEARSESRTYGPRSWERADGQRKSKTCEHAVTGVIAVGAGRGEAFKICIHKGCPTHWPAARAKKSGTNQSDLVRDHREKMKAMARQKREEEERKKWIKALPAIRKAIVERVKKASGSGRGALVTILARELMPNRLDHAEAAKLVPAVRTAEDFLRLLAVYVINDQVGDYWVRERFSENAKTLGLDLNPILADPEAVQTSAPTAAKKARAKSKAKPRAKAKVAAAWKNKAGKKAGKR
jgi:ParB/RepB/Spo0J family partition protein